MVIFDIWYDQIDDAKCGLVGCLPASDGYVDGCGVGVGYADKCGAAAE